MIVAGAGKLGTVAYTSPLPGIPPPPTVSVRTLAEGTIAAGAGGVTTTEGTARWPVFTVGAAFTLAEGTIAPGTG